MAYGTEAELLGMMGGTEGKGSVEFGVNELKIERYHTASLLMFDT